MATKKLFLALVLLLATSQAGAACSMQWSYGDSSWLEGFRFYQDGVLVGTASPSARDALCADIGLVPAPGPVTATAYRGDEESLHSEPASFELQAPGLGSITLSF